MGDALRGRCLRPDAQVAQRAPAANPPRRSSSTRSSVLDLHRLAGNHAVTALLRGSAPGEGLAGGEGQARGEGLDAGTRSYFEPVFGHDFSDVRLHRGAAASRSADSLGAVAYTVGSDVVLGADALRAGGRPDRLVLAHELAHVVQQRTDAAGRAPGRAQESDAEAAASAVAAGARPRVSSRSSVGLAAQPKAGRSGSLAFDAPQPGLEGVTSTTYEELDERVRRIEASPRSAVHDGRRTFSADPKAARANLYHTHFRDDDERLSYALGVFQAALSLDPRGIDPVELHATLLRYAVQMERQRVDVVAHTPPTRAELARAGEVRAEQEQRDFEAYLAEVKRLNEEADKRTVAHGGYSGAATVGLYEYYVGAPVKATAEAFLRQDTRHMVSLMIDFVPIVGQIKGVAEAILGRDLITGDELATWERGLGLLLALLPEAKGIFSSGRAGLRTLAQVAFESGQAADEVYHTAKVASRLTADEVKAAERLAAEGAQATPAQLSLAKKLEEMPGASSGTRGRLFNKPTVTGDPALAAGEGFTTKFGDITYSTKGTAKDVALVRNHELVHSVLSPKLSFLRNFRANLAMGAYERSKLLKYLEEALAESYAQLKVHGIRGLPTGIRFPIANGYVTLSAVLTEAAIGTVVFGGVTYGVYVATKPDDDKPAPAGAP